MLWWSIVGICVAFSITLGVMYGKDVESAKEGWFGFFAFLAFSGVIAFASAIVLSMIAFPLSNFDQIKVEDYELVEGGNIRENYGGLKIVVRENGQITEKTFDSGNLALVKGNNPARVHAETFEWTAPTLIPWNLGTNQYTTITSGDIVQITPN